MDDLLALASEVRDRYIHALLASLAEFKRLHTPSAPEVMFELQRDEALPYRLYRADMATNAGGEAKMQDVNPSTHLSFEPFGVELAEDVTASVRPFVWNDIGVHANTTLPPEPVEAWALRWLDIDDKLTQDENGLQGVIHSITREDYADGSTLLTVDFGSAPVEALREILDLAYAAGSTHVSVSSATLE